MPMYEYQCEKCQKTTEVIQKFSDAPLTTCESCGGTLFKPLQRTAFHLKGGGWYADGYGSGGSKKDTGESATPASSSNSETKTTESSAAPAAASDTGSKPSGGGCCGGGGGH